jgi:hypothetical protein
VRRQFAKGARPGPFDIMDARPKRTGGCFLRRRSKTGEVTTRRRT